MSAQEHRVDSRGLVIPHGSWPASRQAPPALEPVRRFINTENLESGADLVTKASELVLWARSEGLPVPARVSGTELAEARRLRSLLRRAVEDGAPSPDLAAFARRHPVVVQLHPEVGLQPHGRGAATLFSALIISTYTAFCDGTWSRLTCCANEHCRWVVYDHTKRGNVRWCAEEACGSRARARSYRARHAT